MEMGFIKRKGIYGGEVSIYHTKFPDYRATLAIELIERWGLVSAKPDNEDSSGRQKSALMPPSEIVKRACDIADEAITEMENRGWYLEVPAPKDWTE